MDKPKIDRRWVIAAIVGGALLAGFLLPKVGSDRATPAAETSATVAPFLTSSDPSPSAATAAPAFNVFVYVTGAVKRPAVYRLQPSARVIDAIAKAGGALPKADLEQVNLAEPLSDAMKIDVPIKGQTVADAGLGPASQATYHRGSRRHSGTRSGSGGRHKLQAGQTLDVNTASVAELTQLPGVGPGLARRIVEYRQQNGPFQTIDDLQNVSGIGPSKFGKLAPFVRL